MMRTARCACLLMLAAFLAAFGPTARAAQPPAAKGPPAELKVQCALSVDLGVPLKMAPVGKALAARFGEAWAAADAVFLPDAGPSGEMAWVLADGRIVVASRQDPSARHNVGLLELTYRDVARELTAVIPDVKDRLVASSLLARSTYYTFEALQLQVLFVKLPNAFDGWVLSWPDAKQAWAAMVESPVSNMYAKMLLNEKLFLKGSDQEPVFADLSKVRFGEHTLKTDAYQHNGWMTISAFFAKPNGQITLHDKSNKSVVTHASYSRALGDLSVPAVAAPTDRSAAPAAGKSPAVLGHKSALCVDLGTSLEMNSVRQALERKLGKVQAVTGGFLIQQAGPQGEAAWVFADSRVVVASKADLSAAKTMTQLELTYRTVATEIGTVTASVKDETTQARLREGATFYTTAAGQFQRLCARLPSSFYGWTISWPDAAQGWAELVESPVSNMYAKMLLDGRLLLKGSPQEPVFADLSKLRFGEHALKTDGYQHNGWMTVSAFFAKPKGKVALFDESYTSVATHATYSRPLDELIVPVEKE